MPKIYTSKNYFYMKKTTEHSEGLAKDVRVRKTSATANIFYFDNINGWED